MINTSRFTDRSRKVLQLTKQESIRLGHCNLDTGHLLLGTEMEKPTPTIVCLCGSTKFKDAYIKANFDETMSGKIVLSVGAYIHSDKERRFPSEEEKRKLDELHLRKIDLAQEVLFLNVGGYMGESTKRELEYAKKQGKIIRFLEPYSV